MLKRLCLRTFWLTLALALTPIALPRGTVGQQMHSHGKRKIITQIKPVYPVLARKMSLRSVVHLQVTVSPAGYPLRTREIGGSPLLMKSAAEAVSKFEWEPAPLESQELVEIKFPPDSH
jgi:outer membrane biosynthesis protein TonB